MDFFGFFHFFDSLSEFIEAEKSLVYNDVATGKYIILQDQISTKDGKVLGKKEGNTYVFTSLFRDKAKYNKLIDDGIIKEENHISSKEIPRDEFDEFNNLKQAITFNNFQEFIDYIKKYNLE